MDSREKFEKNHLPPIEMFYSNLNMSGISEYNYKHAQRVWKEFGKKNLGDYHDLYLKTDVLLLCNVFETFRTTCLEHYSLDPALFYTSLRLAWRDCLKKTGINLEPVADPDMLLMFEKGIRGGITQTVHRYTRVHNKYMGDKFIPGKESQYLQYLDANNLYGWVMSQPLPAGRFRWVINPEKLEDSIIEMAKKVGKGYLLEVDVFYSKNLHHLHNDLPFMCENRKINVVNSHRGS